MAWHTGVPVALSLGCVVAPLLLLFHHRLGVVAHIGGLFLLAIGVSSFIGAVVSRCINRRVCSARQWFGMLGAVWLLNPVVVVSFAVRLGVFPLAWWSGLPLAFVLIALSGRYCFNQSEHDVMQRLSRWPPRPGALWTWLCLRLAKIGLPLCLLSFQVALYYPQSSLLDMGPLVGLFVCGGFIIMLAKFCMVCACVLPDRDGNQMLSQAFVMAVLAMADVFCYIRFLLPDVITEEVAVSSLLILQTVVGLVLIRVVLQRLQLRPRWQRAWLRRRRASADSELGEDLAAPAGEESTDSDDERGPGSLPNGFHETLIAAIGVPRPTSPPWRPRREYVLPKRVAVVVESPTAATRQASQPGTLARAITWPIPDNSADCRAGGLQAIQVPQRAECVICMEEISNGHEIRPLPKCDHLFHAHCIERWIREKQHDARCPWCRRPALTRPLSEWHARRDPAMAQRFEQGATHFRALQRVPGERRSLTRGTGSRSVRPG